MDRAPVPCKPQEARDERDGGLTFAHRRLQLWNVKPIILL
jgi:hypothetical protein